MFGLVALVAPVLAEETTSCSAIENCAGTVTCNDTSSTCTTCNDGYYGAQCTACTAIDNCAGTVTCTNNSVSVCENCADGYYDTSCDECGSVANCEGQVTCTDATDSECADDGCATGFYKDGNSCTECAAIEGCRVVTCTTSTDETCNTLMEFTYDDREDNYNKILFFLLLFVGMTMVVCTTAYFVYDSKILKPKGKALRKRRGCPPWEVGDRTEEIEEEPPKPKHPLSDIDTIYDETAKFKSRSDVLEGKQPGGTQDFQPPGETSRPPQDDYEPTEDDGVVPVPPTKVQYFPQRVSEGAFRF